MLEKIIASLPAIRPSFLLLAPIAVCYGAAIAVFQGNTINSGHFILTIIGAFTALISVNCINEFQDFESGLDKLTRRTAFSGGSGLLVKRPELVTYVKVLAYFTLMLTLLIGSYFSLAIGPSIIPLGLLGLLLIYFYTSELNKYPWACLIAPGLGIGFLMPLTTYLVLTGKFSGSFTLLFATPFFLINNLLLLNQYPDINADKQAGREHFPIRYGIKKSNAVYVLFAAGAEISVLAAYLLLPLPKQLLFAMMPIMLAVIPAYGIYRLQANIAQQPLYLAINALVANVTPLIISVILFNYSPL